MPYEQNVMQTVFPCKVPSNPTKLRNAGLLLTYKIRVPIEGIIVIIYLPYHPEGLGSLKHNISNGEPLLHVETC
jgi:hypothetical protein